MATTTNYGWTTPDDTSLVKDGASAIRTLGSAVDTSMANLRGGTTGQVLRKTSATQMDFAWATASTGLTLISSTNFSAASSVSLPASTFTTTYTNYRIVFEAKTAAGAGNIGARMRASGTDTTSANYMRQAFIAANTTVSASRNNSATSWDNVISYIDNIQGYANILEIRNPFQSGVYTTLITSTAHNAASTSNEYWALSHGINLTTQFDSMTFIPSTSTITGTVSVYGYNL